MPKDSPQFQRMDKRGKLELKKKKKRLSFPPMLADGDKPELICLERLYGIQASGGIHVRYLNNTLLEWVT